MKIPPEDFTDVTLAMEMMLEVVMGMVDMEFNNVANGVADMVLDMVVDYTDMTLAIDDT